MKNICCILTVIIIVSCNQNTETAAPVQIEAHGIIDSIMAFSDSIKTLDTIAAKTIAQVQLKIASLNQEKKELEERYNNRLNEVQTLVSIDTTYYNQEIVSIRKKLNEANNEIARLKGELASYKKPSEIKTGVVETSQQIDIVKIPDENSIMISIDGGSKKGEIEVPSNLEVFLIPYDKKKTKKFEKYEPYCDENLREFTGSRLADYYKGIYYFNDVQPGKYLIKICTYYGNYKLIDKSHGKYYTSMKLSPPLQ